MYKKILILIVINLIFSPSLSWWNNSWNMCRNLEIHEPTNIPRIHEPIDLFFDVSGWINKPKESSLRLVIGSCNSTGIETDFQIWNITYENNEIKSFNLVSELNSSQTYSLYYDKFDHEIKNSSGIIWLNPTYDWRIRTNLYDLDYDIDNPIENIEGFRKFIFLEKNNENINYAGSGTFGLESIINPKPLPNFRWIYNNTSCIMFERFSDLDSVFCRVCYKSEIIYCEYLKGSSGVHFSNTIRRDLFYDPINIEDLYYRTNIDEDFKKSDLTAFNSKKINFRFGVANTTRGTNFIVILTNGSSFWTTESSWFMVQNPSISTDNYGTLPSLVRPSNWKRLWIAITNESLEKAYERALNWSIVIDYPLEKYIKIGPEQRYQPLEIEFSTPTHVKIKEDFEIKLNISSYNEPISNLSAQNFKIFLDQTEIQPKKFQNLNNGAYSLTLNINKKLLGKSKLNLELFFENQSIHNQKEIFILTSPKEKNLIITNTNWKNYITSSSLNQPTLVYNSSRKLIDKFIEDYGPDVIFQLGTNLTFSNENYIVDSGETLVKIFFEKTDIAIPTDKETALKSSFLNVPILFEPSHETIEYLKPEKIINLTAENINNLFRDKNPKPNYFILTDISEEESMFSFGFSRKNNAFVIITTGNPDSQKNKLIQEIKKFNLPDKYRFEKEIYLLLVGNPHFSVKDPTSPLKKIITDSPYCDINFDGYQDLSCGRLMGSPESISYQLEYSKIFNPEKTALILASYNTPYKYWDALIPGGTMPHVIDSEVELLFKDFEVTRLVERRADFDQVDISVLRELKDIVKEIGVVGASSYPILFKSLFGEIGKIILLAKAGDIALYSFYEFDWRLAWRSLIELRPEYPKHLPQLNRENLLNEIENNQVILYFSPGNETHWLLPINSSWHSVTYEEFDPSDLIIYPLFYYLRYTNSSGISEKVLNRGAISMVVKTGKVYNMQSGETSHHFFKNFDKTVGRAMLETRNRNYENSRMEMSSNKTYEKEYYDTLLIGDPSISFDPSLQPLQSDEIFIENNQFIFNYSFSPTYKIVYLNNSKNLVFENPDDYITEPNKPALPIYKKTIQLPENSTLISLTYSIHKITYDNIDIPIIYDLDYPFENFTGSYPDNVLWNYQIKTLDNATTFDIFFIPTIYHSNGSVDVLSLNLTLKYISPLEILKVNSTDVSKGSKAIITTDIYNTLSQEINTTLLLRIQTDIKDEIIYNEISIKPGRNLYQIIYNNTNSTGQYLVSVALLQPSSGPKYTYFSVYDTSGLTKILYPIKKIFTISSKNFLKEEKNFKEKFSIKSKDGRYIMDYSSPNITIHTEQFGETTISKIKTNEGYLEIQQSSNFLQYNLSSPEGSVLIKKQQGEIEQKFNGDEKKLMEILKNILENYRLKIEELGLLSRY
ncbi:MAG: hypothetical protein QXY45_01580 [Candidatus Aenigmatarchaeota archaeon]